MEKLLNNSNGRSEELEKKILALYKRVEVVDPHQCIWFNFVMHRGVTVRTQVLKNKKGKREAGTSEILKKYNWKVVVTIGDTGVLVVLFESQSEATRFSYQLFYTDEWKFVFDNDEKASIYQAI